MSHAVPSTWNTHSHTDPIRWTSSNPLQRLNGFKFMHFFKNHSSAVAAKYAKVTTCKLPVKCEMCIMLTYSIKKKSKGSVCMCKNLLHTHTNIKHGKVSSWLHDRPLSACVCMVSNVSLHLFWSLIFSHTCVNTSLILFYVKYIFCSTHIRHVIWFLPWNAIYRLLAAFQNKCTVFFS